MSRFNFDMILGEAIPDIPNPTYDTWQIDLVV
jgi:hypothetical protein